MRVESTRCWLRFELRWHRRRGTLVGLRPRARDAQPFQVSGLQPLQIRDW